MSRVSILCKALGKEGRAQVGIEELRSAEALLEELGVFVEASSEVKFTEVAAENNEASPWAK